MQRENGALNAEAEVARVNSVERSGTPVDPTGGLEATSIEVNGSPNRDSSTNGHGDSSSATNGSSSPMELVDEEMAGALELDGGDEYISDDFMQDLRRVKVCSLSFWVRATWAHSSSR
jgi:hypothetical protein